MRRSCWADQSLSDFQTGVGAAAHATLEMEQLISCPWVALFDTLSSLPKAEEGVIPVSEVCELLLRIHDILEGGNEACPSGRKSAGGSVSTSLLSLEERGA